MPGHALTQRPQRIHGEGSFSATSSFVSASSEEDVLVIGTLRSNMANPIIGPPEIILAGSVAKPPPSSTSSAWLAPSLTLTFTGVLNASPVSVITLVIRGVCLHTAL